MFFWDPTMIIVLPALLLAGYAQFKVKSTFEKYSSAASRVGMTGAEVAKKLLEAKGVYDVEVEHVAGQLSDHYDPKAKKVRLSDSVYGKTSLAALGVAAHEVGHALQHNTEYAPLLWRSGLAPAAGFGSTLAWPLLLIGLFGSIYGFLPYDIGTALIWGGIIFFSVAVMFQVVTLPVEFNASGRAVVLLQEQGLLYPDEDIPVRKVLNAAALTYVAAALVSVLNLVRFIILAKGR